jgi:hypothetical protein
LRLISALILAGAALLAAVPVRAQPVTSPGPDSVSVTIYRAPGRAPGSKPNLSWLQGYALITERRTIVIPKGRATIRFEGVAGGILPESAIVTGLPAGVREKNLDADLLNPRSLYARGLGRPVTIRRTLEGKEVEEPAIIRSGPDGAAILQTREGFIAANCGPSDDALIYDGVPQGLSAKPTLSVETEGGGGERVTVTLSYLAWGFDWQANYVATMRPDGKSADLFAWVTLANSDVTSFADAETMVVAGNLNREGQRQYQRSGGEEFRFTCFPTYVPDDSIVADDFRAPPAPPAPVMMMEASDIVVTGSRMRKAVETQQEELGDLKLYRVPDRTTVAAMALKQVAMLDREAVPVDVVYRSRLSDGAEPVMILLRAQNRKDRGLGLPLPAGPVAVFEPRGGASLLIGEGAITDKAVGEEVEIETAMATQVVAELKQVASGEGWGDYALTVTNANPFAVRFEGEFASYGYATQTRLSAKTRRRNGHDVWTIEIPANGKVSLRYRWGELRRK